MFGRSSLLVKQGAYDEELPHDIGFECGGMISVVFSEMVKNLLHKPWTYMYMYVYVYTITTKLLKMQSGANINFIPIAGSNLLHVTTRSHGER